MGTPPIIDLQARSNMLLDLGCDFENCFSSRSMIVLTRTRSIAAIMSSSEALPYCSPKIITGLLKQIFGRHKDKNGEDKA
jgi:hypothetical protein